MLLKHIINQEDVMIILSKRFVLFCFVLFCFILIYFVIATLSSYNLTYLILSHGMIYLLFCFVVLSFLFSFLLFSSLFVYFILFCLFYLFYFVCYNFKNDKKVPSPGIEPGAQTWEACMLPTTPQWITDIRI